MTYAANIENSSERSQYFARLTPRRRIISFTNTSGNTWQAEFDYGPVSGISLNGTDLNYQSTIPLSSGTYYYDPSLERIYVYSTTDPSVSTEFVVVSYELYFSSFGITLSRDPLDYADSKVFWDGTLANVPTFRQTSSDTLFGYFPLEASGLSAVNADGYLNRHLYDSSFSNADLAVYHCLGDLNVANTALVFRGYVRGFSWDSSSVSFTVENLFRGFQSEIDDQLFTTTGAIASAYPNIDPNAKNTSQPFAIRRVYGRVDGLIPINADYNATPSHTTNRNWIVCRAEANGLITRAIDTGGTNTTSITTVTNADGIMPGDWIYLDDVAEAAEVAGVDYGTKQIVHTTVAARSVSPGDNIYRESVGYVYIRIDGVNLKLEPILDYTIQFDATRKLIYIDLEDNFEAHHSGTLSIFDPSTMQIFCRVYGQNETIYFADETTPVATVNQQGGNINSIGAFIYDFASRAIGKDAMDEDSFTDLVTDNQHLVGFTVPFKYSDYQYPTYYEVILKLMQSGLVRMHSNIVNNEMVVSVSSIGPTGAVAKTLTDDLTTRVTFTVDYDNTFQKVLLIYQPTDYPINSQTAFREPLFRTSFGDAYLKTSGSTAANNIGIQANYIHSINSTFDIETVLILENDARDVADRLIYTLSDRRGRFTVSCKNDAFLAKLSETYRLSRARLPGFDLDLNTLNARDGIVTDTAKTIAGVELTIDDQKGIEDNSGSW